MKNLAHLNFMDLIFKAVYLFILSLMLAVLEVQIEGPCGWAEKLPTWRPKSEHWLAKIYSRLMSGKPLTGYHLSIFIFLLVILHLPFAWTMKWSFEEEMKIISFFFLTVTTWDFLWFVVNPCYGLKKFKAIYVWWHKKWLGPWPIDYYYGIVLSAVFYLFAAANNYLINLKEWVEIFGVFLILSILVVIIRWLKTADGV